VSSSVYAGSASCKECHEETYAAWAQSDHAHAERLIDPTLDRPAFSPSQEILHGSVRSTVRVRDGRFEIVTLGADGEMSPFVPVRVFGRTPLRQFLVPADGGRLQVTALAHDPHVGDWFDVYGDEDRRPHEWGSWTNRGMNWNSMCAACHNTGLRKGYDPVTDTYKTTYSELAVGCEACHGPSQSHVDWQIAHPDQPDDPTAPSISQMWLMDLCGSCHSRRLPLTEAYRHGDPFLDHFRAALPDHTEIYYPDGQVHEEDYVYMSFKLSRMYFKGIRCNDCHVRCATRLIAEDNELCLRCHGVDADPDRRLEYQIDPAEHSHHKLDEPGGLCVNCHMPITVYMQRDERHDHGMTIPDPHLTREHGTPNACNRCHTDQTVDWAIEATEKWYGSRMDRPTRVRARLFARARQGDEAIVSELATLARTEEHPAWQAVVARFLERWSSRPEAAEVLLEMLRHEDPLVRTEAAGALEPVARMVAPALQTLLDDPVRAVRVQAAWALRSVLPLTTRAGQDLTEFLATNADQPTGAMMQGTFHHDRGEMTQAVGAFRRAVEFEPNGALQRHELAVALSAAAEQAAAVGDNKLAAQRSNEAIEQLFVACELTPKDAEMAHALGLAYAGVGQMESATEWLKRAVQLDDGFARAAYNLGLAYDAAGEFEDAVKALRRAEEIDRTVADYPFALATVLEKLGRANEAREAAQRTLAVDPNHAQATRFLNELLRRAK